MADMDEVDARHGEKMIEITIRLWTDEIAEQPKKIKQKHAWAKGIVHIQQNKAHGIVPGKGVPFQSLLGLGSAIEKLLKQHEIVLHISNEADRYLAPRPAHAKPKSRWARESKTTI